MATTQERIILVLGRLYQLEQEIGDIGTTASFTHWTERQRLDETRIALAGGRIALSQILAANEQMAQLATQDKAHTQITWHPADRRR